MPDSQLCRSKGVHVSVLPIESAQSFRASSAMLRLKFFTTGGTIDKVYFDAKSEFEVGSPQVLEVVREANVAFEYDIESILRKDSLDMTDADRALVRERVMAEPCSLIVITHGTDTMVQ